MRRGTIRAVALCSAAMLSAARGEPSSTSGPTSTNASARGVEKVKQEAKDAVTNATAYFNHRKAQGHRAFSERSTRPAHPRPATPRDDPSALLLQASPG